MVIPVPPSRSPPFATLNSNNTYVNNTSNGSNKSKSHLVSQFESWSNEETVYRQNAIRADRDRTILNDKLQQVRVEQKQLSIQLREYQELFGKYRSEHSILVHKVDHLEGVKKDENVLIQQCTNEINELLINETKMKHNFCNEMNELNQELSYLLLQQESLRLQNMITVETIPIIIEQYQKRRCNEHDVTLPSAGINSPDSESSEIASVDWFHDQVREPIKSMKSIDSHYKSTLAEWKRLHRMIEMYRDRMQSSSSSNSAATKDDILAFEESWQQKNDNSIERQVDGSDDKDSKQMNLFYTHDHTNEEDDSQND